MSPSSFGTFCQTTKTLIGSDSHTPTSSAIGCIAIGAGGLDVAKAMAGIGYRLTCPKVVEVKLTGTLAHGVSSKDIILKLLELLSVKGGVGKVLNTLEKVSKFECLPKSNHHKYGS